MMEEGTAESEFKEEMAPLELFIVMNSSYLGSELTSVPVRETWGLTYRRRELRT